MAFRRSRTKIVFLVVATFASAPGPALMTPGEHQEPNGEKPSQRYGYRIIRSYHHDRTAFTEGLAYADGKFYEGLGLNGFSEIRKIHAKTGRVIQARSLDSRYFGEGIAVWKNRLIQLTWNTGTAFVYDRATFRLLRTFSYDGEGWGLTQDGHRLIMSDGTDTLRFRDPETFVENGRLRVSDNGSAVKMLNELEYVDGEIYANVFLTDTIVRISPETGKVLGWIELNGLLGQDDKTIPDDLRRKVRGALNGLLTEADLNTLPLNPLNGIAWDPNHKRLFVTGKLWPKIFEIELVPKISR